MQIQTIDSRTSNGRPKQVGGPGMPGAIRALVSALMLLLACAVAAHSAIIIDAPMTGTSQGSWVLGGSPNPAILTGNGTIDPVGQGWLRLSNATGNQTGYAWYNQAFDLSQGVIIQFDYVTWGGTGADGYNVYLFDAGAATSFNIGAFGGSLGYAQKTGIAGISGGYVGVGIDEYGNFASPTEGRYGGTSQQPNTVTVRGPVTGLTTTNHIGNTTATNSYPWIATSPNNGSLWVTGTNTTRPNTTDTNYRKVIIKISPVPNPAVSAWVQFGASAFPTPMINQQPIIDSAGSPVNPPASVMIGYAASTGGSTNYHEIRNLLVNSIDATASIDLGVSKSAVVPGTATPITSIAVGSPLSYLVTVRNSGPNNVTANNVGVIDTLPAQLTGVTWTCVASGPVGTSCGAASGTGSLNTTANLPVNGSVTYTVTGTLTSTPSGNQLVNTASLTIPGGITDYNSANNSATSTIPVISAIDLGITKTASVANISVGSPIAYTVVARNNGPASVTVYNAAVADTLPPELTGVTWTCAAAGGAVCTSASGTGNLNTSANLPLNGTATYTITGTLGSSPAVAQLSNTAQIAPPAGLTDSSAANNSATVSIPVISNLSTSTKTVLDVNGGDANPGDVLRYTITLTESTGNVASGVTVTDNLPANVTTFTVVSIPAGATNSSTGTGTGSNGTGYLNITGIPVPAGGSVTIVFDVTIAAATPTGTLINNTATIANPAGTGATPGAPTVIVSGGSIPGTGNKPLYLYDATSTPANKLSRTPMAVTPASFVAIPRGTVTTTWTESPPLQSAVKISSGSIPVQLWLSTDSTRTYSIPVTLRCGATSVATQTQSIALTSGAAAALSTFSLPLAAAYTCPAGSAWALDITNTQAAGGGARNIRVYPAPAANSWSNVSLPSQNVINVDSIGRYDAAYPAGNLLTSVAPGGTVRVRATVSDPFGSFDINSATLTLTDTAGAVKVNAAAMTQVYDSGAATKIYEYAYTVPSTGPTGNWTIRVVAREGTEGTVTDYAVAALPVAAFPNITIVKSAQTSFDPANGGTNPKSIPGAQVIYTLLVTNFGLGAADANSVVITDPIPANTSLVVSGTPVGFANGTPVSGLTFTWGGLGSLTDDVQFSRDGVDFTYAPTIGANGTDATVRYLRINPKGQFNASNGSGSNPGFTLTFTVVIN